MRRGQATTEYFVIVSVIVIGLVATAWVFMPAFQQGMTGLDDDTTTLLSEGQGDGHGDKR